MKCFIYQGGDSVTKMTSGSDLDTKSNGIKKFI